MNPPLAPGEPVSVVAPSGPYAPEPYQRGLEILRSRGHEPVEVLAGGPHRYLAASDADRAASLRRAFADDGRRVVFAARGGYGAMRLLPQLDLRAMAASGKVLVGFSDVTALHVALLAHGGRTVHAPNVTTLSTLAPTSIDRLVALLESGEPPPPLAGRSVVEGRAEGRLVGGNLAVLSSLAGTPYLPDLAGCVLLLEEVTEQPYRLDRMWTQLRLAGVLERVAGVAFGDLTSCETPGATFTGWQVVEDLLRDLGKPAVVELPIGHGERNEAVPLGARVTLEGGSLRFHEGA